MSIVILASGGLDSTLISLMSKEAKIDTYPLFIDYGQKAAKKEWTACIELHKKWDLPEPRRMDIAGFGKVISSGLTDNAKDVRSDAFTPCRNLIFLVMAGSYAFQVKADAIAIGLLSEETSLFPDQRGEFIRHAEAAIQSALGINVKIVTPLSTFTKLDVVKLAQQKGLAGTYSCHAGSEVPCRKCISCLEVFGSTT